MLCHSRAVSVKVPYTMGCNALFMWSFKFVVL